MVTTAIYVTQYWYGNLYILFTITLEFSISTVLYKKKVTVLHSEEGIELEFPSGLHCCLTWALESLILFSF